MIEFESVGKTFRDGTAAVVDLSLQVPSDKITVIVGPSGCGKTTTLRMVNRMIEPTRGRIIWDGSPLRSKRKTTLRRQMGYVIQSGGLFPHRTVVDNIGTVPGLLGWSRSKIQSRSLELLDSVGLDRKLADRYPAQLSGGQQQRVGVARALAADPLVLLMDEPFSAVDPVVRSELHEFFLNLQRQISKTIILITHDIDEAIKLGDQVAILRVGGHLAQVGTPQQLLDEPADAFVEGFVGRDRGYRSLSFQPASSLNLDGVPVVRDVASASGTEPTLVVDGDARPLAWVDPARPGQTLPLGSTFDVESGTLRGALDAVLTSPVGLAVGVVPGTGRYAGVVTTEVILAGVHQLRAPQHDREAINVERADAGTGGADAPGADEHAGTAELGDEGGHDIDPASLTGIESELSAAEDRSPRADADDVDARR
jgi:osmoprotectant transport system ATP-binding protein